MHAAVYSQPCTHPLPAPERERHKGARDDGAVMHAPSASAEQALGARFLPLLPMQLSGRRLQNHGGIVHTKGLIPAPLPGWLQQLLTALPPQLLGLFPADQPPNHVLINSYQPGCGIMVGHRHRHRHRHDLLPAHQHHQHQHHSACLDMLSASCLHPESCFHTHWQMLGPGSGCTQEWLTEWQWQHSSHPLAPRSPCSA